MRISDWSSDVCSSDLARGACVEGAGRGGPTLPDQPGTGPAGRGWIHAPLPERRNSLDPLEGQLETGAREPSEDTVKRATFARMEGPRSWTSPLTRRSTGEALPSPRWPDQKSSGWGKRGSVWGDRGGCRNIKKK